MNINNEFLYSRFNDIIWFVMPKAGSRSMHMYFREHNFKFPWEECQTLPEDYANCFKFVFVRNPWDRLLSAWKNKVEYLYSDDCPEFKLRYRIPYFKQYKDKDFNFFVKDMITSKDRHLELQCNLFHPDVDFIGRFENIQKDFNIVCNTIGIPQQKLSHKNKSNRKHYTEYYDDETRQIVAEKYAKDIEYFGYEFGE